MRTIVFGTILLATATASARPHRSRVAQEEEDRAADQEDDDDGGAEARAKYSFKIEELITAAVRNAPDLARVIIDQKAASLAAEGARRDQAWIGSVNTQAKRSALAENVEAPPFSEVANNELYAGVGLGRNLPTGGNLQLEAGFDRKDTEYNIVSRLHQAKEQQQAPAGSDQNGNPYDILQRNTSMLKATYKQPLARGFGPAVTLAPERRADLQATEATMQAQLKAEELVRDLVAAYWDVALANYTLDVRQQALKLAQEQEKIVNEQFRAGQLAPTAKSAVSYEIQMREDAFLRAQIDLEQKSLELRQKAGLEIGKRDIVVVPDEKLEIAKDEWDFNVDEVLARSHEANRKLATIQIEQKLADVDVDVAESQTKPQLDLTFSGSVMGDGENAGGSLNGIGDSYEVSVGLSLSFELSGAAKKARDAALQKRRRLDVDRADTIRQIDTAVVIAVHQVQASRKRVELADTAIINAEDNAKAEMDSFRMNRSTAFQVTQRRNDLIDARIAKGQAVADYYKAVAQLQFLSGDLLDQYGVNVKRRGERK